ncbi:MAG: AEC family transporter, partial [Rickettsiales bacterium]
MFAIFFALAPLFIFLMIGMTLRRTGFLSDSFWKGLEKLAYWALLPALFFKTMVTANFSGLTLLPAMFAAFALLAMMMVLLILLRPAARHTDGATYSSLIQGATRFNNYVGLPVTLSLFGETGIVVYAIIISGMIPLTNVTSVWALSHYASHEKVKWRIVGWRIITNPLIVSTLLGIAVNLMFNTGKTGLPPVINEVVTAMANASLLMGILTIGAGLDPAAIRTDRARVLYACFLKLVLFPAIAVGCGLLFGLNNLAMSVLILFAALFVVKYADAL